MPRRAPRSRRVRRADSPRRNDRERRPDKDGCSWEPRARSMEGHYEYQDSETPSEQKECAPSSTQEKEGAKLVGPFQKNVEEMRQFQITLLRWSRNGERTESW